MQQSLEYIEERMSQERRNWKPYRQYYSTEEARQTSVQDSNVYQYNHKSTPEVEDMTSTIKVKTSTPNDSGPWGTYSYPFQPRLSMPWLGGNYQSRDRKPITSTQVETVTTSMKVDTPNGSSVQGPVDLGVAIPTHQPSLSMLWPSRNYIKHEISKQQSRGNDNYCYQHKTTGNIA